jgi:hypothetical protein
MNQGFPNVEFVGYMAAQSGPRNLRTAMAASFGGPDVNRSMVKLIVKSLTPDR